MDGDEAAPVTERLLRLPAVLSLFPISKSAWWLGIKQGRYPKPLRIGQRSVAWRKREILALINSCEPLRFNLENQS